MASDEFLMVVAAQRKAFSPMVTSVTRWACLLSQVLFEDSSGGIFHHLQLEKRFKLEMPRIEIGTFCMQSICSTSEVNFATIVVFQNGCEK